jgi:hypothetical protein
MNKQALCVVIAAALAITSAPAVAQNTAPAAIATGKTLYDGGGRKVGAIYRVTAEGNPQVILNGMLVTVPSSTISDANGKITTSLSRADLGRMR